MNLKPPKRTGKLLTIAFPCFVEQLLGAVMTIISTMIVGRLGSAALTAVSMSNTMVNWLQCVYTGLAAGSTVVIARMWGAGDRQGVKRTFMQSVLLNTTLGVSIMLFLVIFQEQVIGLLFGGAAEEVKANMRIYFRLAMIAMPGTALCNIIAACLRGIGDNRSVLYYSGTLNVLNVLISYTLIYGIRPLHIPAFGVLGAGIGVIAARYLTAVLFLVYIIAVHKPILPERFRFRLEFSLLRRIAHVGIPSAIDGLIFQGGFVILQSMLVSFGTIFQAGYQIGGNFNVLVTVPSMAMNVAVTAVIGQALGHQGYREAKEKVKAVRYIYATAFSVIGALAFLLAGLVARCYTNEPETIREAIFFIRLFAVESFAVGYLQSMSGVLKGAGDNKYILFTNMLGLWCCRLGVTWVLSRFTDPHVALAIGMSMDFYLRAILYHFRVEKGKWLTLKV